MDRVDEHVHEFHLVEVRQARRGLDKHFACECGETAVELSEAAMDHRPPLGPSR